MFEDQLFCEEIKLNDKDYPNQVSQNIRFGSLFYSVIFLSDLFLICACKNTSVCLFFSTDYLIFATNLTYYQQYVQAHIT